MPRGMTLWRPAQQWRLSILSQVAEATMWSLTMCTFCLYSLGFGQGSWRPVIGFSTAIAFLFHCPFNRLCMAVVWPRIFCPLGFIWPLASYAVIRLYFHLLAFPHCGCTGLLIFAAQLCSTSVNFVCVCPPLHVIIYIFIVHLIRFS